MKSEEERFWEKVNKDGPVPAHCPELGPCWVWTAAKNKGYGVFTFQGRQRQVHAVAFFLHNGVWPEPFGLHQCDNRPCCNPGHIKAGTHHENMREMVERGGQARCSRHGRAKFTDDDIRTMRALRESGWSLKRLAEKYDIDFQRVSLICLRKCWKDVT